MFNGSRFYVRETSGGYLEVADRRLPSLATLEEHGAILSVGQYASGRRERAEVVEIAERSARVLDELESLRADGHFSPSLARTVELIGARGMRDVMGVHEGGPPRAAE